MDPEPPPNDNEMERDSGEKKQKKKKKKSRKSSAKTAEGTMSSLGAGESPFSRDSLSVDEQLEAVQRRSSKQSDDGIDRKHAPNRSGADSNTDMFPSNHFDPFNSGQDDAFSKSNTRTVDAKAAAADSLDQTEQDISAKTKTKVTAAASRRSKTTKSALEQMEKDVTSSQSVGAHSSVGGSQVDERKQRPPPRSSLENLEARITAKTRGHDLEQRALQASRASSVPSSENDPDAEMADAKRAAMGPPPPQPVPATARASATSTEEDLVAKGSAAAVAAAASIAIAASSSGGSGDAGFGNFAAFDEEDSKLKSNELNMPRNDGTGPAYGSATYQHGDGDGRGGSAPRESALAGFGGSTDVELAGAPEIEAFVADQVVDATGVAVVMSEAEEERLERKKHRRYFLLGALAFLLVASGVVAGVVLALKPPPPAPLEPTSMPSMAPSLVPSQAPTTSRMDSWITALTPMVADDIFENSTSPQFLAVKWLADEDEVQTEVGSERGIQRFVLATFYFALDGDNWIQCGRLDITCGGDPNNRSWLLDDEHECDWLAVNCDITGNVVTGIFFARQLGGGLAGYLPSELTLLTDLQTLILQRNELIGTIPTFLGECTKLVSLFMLGNQFEGSLPDEILRGATMLGTLHFGENLLTGSVPTLISELPLKTLNLYSNNMTGSLPSELGELSLLTHLELQNNRFNGNIPEELYNARSLTRIRLNGNELEGTLSSLLGQMIELEELALGGNTRMRGSIPASFYTLPKISDFRLEQAQMTGTLSNDLAQMNQTLRRIYLYENQMTGALPIAGIEALTNMNELLLHQNNFTGTVSDAICAEKGLLFFDLQNLTLPPEVDCSATRTCCNVQV